MVYFSQILKKEVYGNENQKHLAFFYRNLFVLFFQRKFDDLILLFSFGLNLKIKFAYRKIKLK